MRRNLVKVGTLPNMTFVLFWKIESERVKIHTHVLMGWAICLEQLEAFIKSSIMPLGSYLIVQLVVQGAVERSKRVIVLNLNPSTRPIQNSSQKCQHKPDPKNRVDASPGRIVLGCRARSRIAIARYSHPSGKLGRVGTSERWGHVAWNSSQKTYEIFFHHWKAPL